jgi:cytochrome c biogenesis protein
VTETKSTAQPGGGGPAAALWKFFTSVHLAVILLLLLSAVSIIGTVLAQGPSQDDNVQLFEKFVVSIYDTFGIVDPADPAQMAAQSSRIRAAAERLTIFSKRAGFTDLYHTWYFYLLLGLFSLNLLLCSIKRWPLTWKLIAKNKVRLEEKRFATMANRRTLTLDGDLAGAREKVLAAMKKAGFTQKIEEGDGKVYFFGQKGVVSRLGVYSTHLSIIVVLIGGIIGVTAGFKGYIQITEGTAETRFWDRGSETRKVLPFEVRCDNFQVDYYPGTMRPKDFYSDLTIVEDGEEKFSKRIEVNDPLVWNTSKSPLATMPVLSIFFARNIWFYQSSYGETGQGVKATLKIVDPATGEEHLESFDGRTREVSVFGVTVDLLQIIPDFALDANQKPTSKSNQPNNPAALVEVRRADGSAQRTWLFQRYPETKMAEGLPVDLTFVDYGGIQYTGLQVVYDPGVWVIWLGCTVMVIGLYLAFFISHRRVWVRIGEADGAAEIKIAGSANKNRDAFVVEFERFGSLIAGIESEGSEK